MSIRRNVLRSLLASLSLQLVPASKAQAPGAAKEAAGAFAGETDHLAAKIAFRFDVLDLVTHQDYSAD
jgi:hypothetical protein